MDSAEQPQWKGKSRGGSLGYLSFILTIKYLGVGAAYALLTVVAPYFVLFAPKATASIWRYNRRILGYGWLRSAAMIVAHYYRFGQTLIDKLAIVNGMGDRYRYEFENYEEFLSVLNAPSGVVMIGAHVGSWEVGSPFFDKYGKKINIVLFDGEYRNIKKVAGQEDAKNYKVIPVGEDALQCVIEIKNAIDRGEYVCFQGDRYLNDKATLRHRFLGHEATFPAGPFLIASRLSVPVVFYFATKERRRHYKFHFVIARPTTRNSVAKREEQLLNQYVETLEQIVKQHPRQWFNFYDFWK